MSALEPGARVALVPLTAQTVKALRRTAALSGVTESEVINYAIQAWALIQQHQAEGGSVLLEMADGRVGEVVLTSGPPETPKGLTDDG